MYISLDLEEYILLHLETLSLYTVSCIHVGNLSKSESWCKNTTILPYTIFLEIVNFSRLNK